jgi:urease subunit gamma
MELTPREKDKLLLFTAGLLAERRKDMGARAQLPGGHGLHQLCRAGRGARGQERC